MQNSFGLRARKKQQTRLAISDIATRMFIARGFDKVTVAEVAEAANVSVNTIFNYFSTKEELFFDRAEDAIEETSRIVRERRPGESPIDALYRTYRQTLKRPGSLFGGRDIRPFFATIEASPALLLHVGRLFDESEERLARTLMAETAASPDDPTPRAVAALIISQLRMVASEFRARLLRDESAAKIRAALLRATDRSFDLLQKGVGQYAIRGGVKS
jgi:AcrR family transcriptional regulator